MKKLYIAPNAELLLLAAEERLASEDSLEIGKEGIVASENDIDVDLGEDWNLLS